ncbi:MAG: hypothetical protein ACLRPT_01270 [Akkermansia muciniphila]
MGTLPAGTRTPAPAAGQSVTGRGRSRRHVLMTRAGLGWQINRTGRQALVR